MRLINKIRCLLGWHLEETIRVAALEKPQYIGLDAYVFRRCKRACGYLKSGGALHELVESKPKETDNG